MEAKIEGDYLVITMPINSPLTPSKTKKSLVVVTTNGPMESGVKIADKTVMVNLTAYISAR